MNGCCWSCPTGSCTSTAAPSARPLSARARCAHPSHRGRSQFSRAIRSRSGCGVLSLRTSIVLASFTPLETSPPRHPFAQRMLNRKSARAPGRPTQVKLFAFHGILYTSTERIFRKSGFLPRCLRRCEMRTDKFTVKTQEAIAAAQASAERLGQQAVDVEHVLVALLQQTDGAVVPIVQKIGADPAAIVRELEEGIGRLPRVSGGLTEQTYVTPRLAKTLRRGAARGRHAQGRLHRGRTHPARGDRCRRRGRPCSQGRRREPRGGLSGDAGGARQPAHHRPEPGGEVPVAAAVRARPHRAWRAGASSTP